MTHIETCPTCGQKINPHKERITPGLVKTLYKFAGSISKKGVNKLHPRKELSLTISEYNNFQKLRYHGLVAKVKEDGVFISGYWLLTTRGQAFLRGNLKIPSYVVIFNNRITERSEEKISAHDVLKSRDLPYFETIDTVEYEPVNFTKEGQGILI